MEYDIFNIYIKGNNSFGFYITENRKTNSTYKKPKVQLKIFLIIDNVLYSCIEEIKEGRLFPNLFVMNELRRVNYYKKTL